MYVLHSQPNIPDSLPHKRGGHCSKCQRFVRESRKDAFKRHFIGCKGPQPAPSGDSFVPDDRTCDICGKTFTQKEKFLKHLCKRHPASPTACKYVLCDRNGPLKRVLDDLDPLQLYSLCFHHGGTVALLFRKVARSEDCGKAPQSVPNLAWYTSTFERVRRHASVRV